MILMKDSFQSAPLSYLSEPSATDLISLFLYQAELASATAKEIINKENQVNGESKGDHLNGTLIFIIYVLISYGYES